LKTNCISIIRMIVNIIILLACKNLAEDEQWTLPRIEIQSLFQDDWSREEAQETISRIQKAAADVGFFSIVNHGVSEELLKGIHNAANRFFDEPRATKMKFALQEYNSESQTRYRGFWPREVFGKECVAFGNPSWRSSKTNLPCHEAMNLELLKSNFGPEWLKTIQKYWHVMLSLGKILIHAITNSSSIPFHPETSVSTLRFNHYPRRGKAEEPQHFGRDDLPLSLEEHVDNSLITILSQDDVDGLQLLGIDNLWHSIPYEPGTLVVNTGYSLSVLTDGRYNATNHRVKWIRSRRITIPFFVEPDANFPLISLASSPVEKAEADGYWRWLLTQISTKGEFENRGRTFLAEMDSESKHVEL